MLETGRLLFRPHRPEDLEPYCEMESDAVYRSPQQVHPRGELERSFSSWLQPRPMGLLATVYRPEGRYIGRCGLYPYRGPDDAVLPGEAFIAFYLARPYWGRGLATEAGRCFVEHGFRTLKLRRIQAGINAENRASRRVLEKLGFRQVGNGGGGAVRWHDFELINPYL